MEKYSVLSLSGGMDSSTLLLKLLSQDDNVIAISFDYGQKHVVELDRAKQLVRYLQDNDLSVKHKIIKLDGLQELLYSTLVKGNDEVPEGHYKEKNMKQTVVPNRNKIFSSIIQSVALSVSQEKDVNCRVALGIHAGDHDIYPDASREFIYADYKAFVTGNWDTYKVGLYTPYLEIEKSDVLKDGLKVCEELNLSFSSVYRRTITSYKPNKKGYSDYKSASSVERIEAFIKLGKRDPLTYADENGIVSWKTVKEKVLKFLESN